MSDLMDMKRLFLLLALLPAIARAQSPPQPGFFADMQALWFDSSIGGDLDFAPRFVLGYDNDVGGRVRYWTYGQSNLAPGAEVRERLTLDAIDLEATTHLRYEAADFVLSGGARIGQLSFSRDFLLFGTRDARSLDFAGLTFAADGRTLLAGTETWRTSLVYGGRLSMLDGDWQGVANTPRDRLIVPEVSTGVEAAYGHAFTRLTVEMASWDSRDRARYNFTGWGFDLGVMY